MPKRISAKNTLISSLIHSAAFIKEGIPINVDDLIITLLPGY